MLEPAPRKISLPETEPKIRVGLILPEDGLTELQIGNTEDYYLNDSLQKAGELKFSVEDGKLRLNDSLLTTLTLKQDKKELKSSQGFKVSSVIAGRSFHWRKKITASYPGNLEITVENDCIKLINELSFEDYLTCVATSEMSSECPAEFMKAQIIAARSWAMVFLGDKHPGSGFDVCNDDDCQRYQGTTFLSENAINAAKETKAIFLTDQGSILPAYYIKSCGGISEECKAIFGFEENALRSIQDSEKKLEFSSFQDFLDCNPQDLFCGQADSMQIEKYLGKVDSGGSHFRWSQKVSATELRENISNKLAIHDFKRLTAIKSIKRSISYRITNLELCYTNTAGEENTILLDSQYKVREILSPSFLPSSAFKHEIDQEGNISFSGAGWGHGVGLCQIGGVVMALKGYKAEEILLHYFPQAKLSKAYKL